MGAPDFMREMTRAALRRGEFAGVKSKKPLFQSLGDIIGSLPVPQGYGLRSSSNTTGGSMKPPNVPTKDAPDETLVVLPSQFPYTLKNCGAARFQKGLPGLPPPTRKEIELLCHHHGILVFGFDTTALVTALLARKRPPAKAPQLQLSDSDKDSDSGSESDDLPLTDRVLGGKNGDAVKRTHGRGGGGRSGPQRTKLTAKMHPRPGATGLAADVPIGAGVGRGAQGATGGFRAPPPDAAALQTAALKAKVEEQQTLIEQLLAKGGARQGGHSGSSSTLMNSSHRGSDSQLSRSRHRHSRSRSRSPPRGDPRPSSNPHPSSDAHRGSDADRGSGFRHSSDRRNSSHGLSRSRHRSRSRSHPRGGHHHRSKDSSRRCINHLSPNRSPPRSIIRMKRELHVLRHEMRDVKDEDVLRRLSRQKAELEFALSERGVRM